MQVGAKATHAKNELTARMQAEGVKIGTTGGERPAG
jgi:hypothetical protein